MLAFFTAQNNQAVLCGPCTCDVMSQRHAITKKKKRESISANIPRTISNTDDVQTRKKIVATKNSTTIQVFVTFSLSPCPEPIPRRELRTELVPTRSKRVHLKDQRQQCHTSRRTTSNDMRGSSKSIVLVKQMVVFLTSQNLRKPPKTPQKRRPPHKDRTASKNIYGQQCCLKSL